MCEIRIKIRKKVRLVYFKIRKKQYVWRKTFFYSSLFIAPFFIMYPETLITLLVTHFSIYFSYLIYKIQCKYNKISSRVWNNGLNGLKKDTSHPCTIIKKRNIISLGSFRYLPLPLYIDRNRLKISIISYALCTVTI